ncbi:Pyridine nucleotide-disulfide oxidoreductase domain-containing protein 1 [Allomyces javanicus]|nr:Pyridine nucleotide-disulfide oxidoreductase domain-containing protein 1 [Allomyces javanicus]
MVKYVVLGGGVAGVTCAEELSRLVGTDDEVFLISQSRILKIVTNVQAFSKTTETFDLVPTDLEQYRIQSRFHVLQGTVARIDRVAQHVVTASGTVYPYDKLCIATGGRPHVLFDNPHVMAIRDIESVEDLCARLSTARRIMVVGNGGIALELLNEIRRIPIVWAIKDNYLGNTFLDAEASAFFEPHLFTQNEPIYSRILAASPAQTLATPPPVAARTNSSARPLPAKPRSPPPPAAACESPADSAAPAPTAASRKRKNRVSVASPPPDATRRPPPPPPTPAAPGASLGPVWRASLVLPPPPIHAAFSDRDLVIERECHVEKVWTADEFRRRTHKKKRRTESGPPSAIDRSDDDDEEVVVPAPPPAVTGSVEFVPHMGRFGEGRLGLVPRDEVGEGEEDKPVPFPATASGAGTPTAPVNVPPKNDWPLYVQLSNKRLYGVDLLISATGVVPNSELATDVGLDVAPAPAARTRSAPPTALDAAQAATAALTPARGGIAVDKGMRTSDANIYAAGDCAACVWAADRAAHWFQMRLWSQARSMGLQAARSMVRDVAAAQMAAVEAPARASADAPPTAATTAVVEAKTAPSNGLASVPRAPPAGDMHLPDGRVLPAPLDVHFDLFAHVSRFFGFKVVLLGRFNAQGLAPGTYDVMVRSSHAGEYVKVVKDRATKQLQGAMLIGETDLEELFENLILTRADVSFLDDVVLDPDVDLDAPVFDDEPLGGAGGDAFGHDDFDLALAYGPGGGGTGVGGVMSASASPALVDVVGGGGVGDDVALF